MKKCQHEDKISTLLPISHRTSSNQFRHSQIASPPHHNIPFRTNTPHAIQTTTNKIHKCGTQTPPMSHLHTAYIYSQRPPPPLLMRPLIQTLPHNHIIILRCTASKNLRVVRLDHRRPSPRIRRREVNLHSTRHPQKARQTKHWSALPRYSSQSPRVRSSPSATARTPYRSN